MRICFNKYNIISLDIYKMSIGRIMDQNSQIASCYLCSVTEVPDIKNLIDDVKILKNKNITLEKEIDILKEQQKKYLTLEKEIDILKEQLLHQQKAVSEILERPKIVWQ
jgi:hypothetical protein